jgi:S1-C subfamily serine protease
MKKVLILFFTTLILISCGVSANTKSNSNVSSNNVASQRFGLSVIDLDASHKDLTDLSHGVVVESVYSGLPSNASGILKGDIIVTLGENNVFNLENFNEILNKYKYEYGQVKMGVVRNGQLQKFILYLN